VTFGHISCRAEPNPTTTFHHSTKAFHADPHHAIAIFSLTVGIDNGLLGFLHHLDLSSNFVFFVHRSSLLKCIDQFSTLVSPGGEASSVPYSQWGPPICRWFAGEAFPTRWITTTAGQRCITMPDIGSEIDSTPLILLNFNQKDVMKVLEAEKSERNAWDRAQRAKERLAALTSQGDPQLHQEIYEVRVNLEEAMLQLGLSVEEYNQRPISLDDHNEGDDPGTNVLSDNDFSDLNNSSPVRRKRVKAMTQLSDALDDPHHCFQNITYSGLPYTVCLSKEKYSFHGALLDEEMILGLRVSVSGP
jgi:hypothetical protein